MLMYGMLIFSFGIAMYLLGVLMVFPRYLLGLDQLLKPLNEWIVWYSGIPIITGIVLALLICCSCWIASAATCLFATRPSPIRA